MLTEKGQRHRPGVVNKHIDPAVGIYREFSHCENIVLFRHVCYDVAGLTARRLDLRHGLLQLLFAACRQNDLAAHLCGSLCSQLAEAAGGAGDNNDLAFHVVFLNVIALVCLQFNYLLSD